MLAGNNKSIRDWPINSLVGYASQEYAKNHAIREWEGVNSWMGYFVSGIIREWDNSWVGQNTCPPVVVRIRGAKLRFNML
jgi:hypothetical protein